MTSPERDPSVYERNNPHQIQPEHDMQSQNYQCKAKQETIATHIVGPPSPTCFKEKQQQQRIQANDQQSQQAVQPPSQEAQKIKLTTPVGDKRKRKRKLRLSIIPECIPQQPPKLQETTQPFKAANLQLMEALNFPPSKPARIRGRRGTSRSFKRGSKRLEDMFASSKDRINPRLNFENNPKNGDTVNSLQSVHSHAQIQQNDGIGPPNGSNQPAAGSNPQVPGTMLSQGSNFNPMQGTGTVSRWKRLKKFTGLGQKF